LGTKFPRSGSCISGFDLGVLKAMFDVDVVHLKEDALRALVQEQTPEGWYFTVDQSSETRLWEACFLDSKGESQWEISDITLKQVLLHALGWLQVRRVKLPEGSLWAPRTVDRAADRAHERAFQATSNEVISDLETEEIASVYEKRGTK
jgi:hypothetical protein